jgi:type VI secretion system protein ImpE
MASPEELVRQGDLLQALQCLQDRVRRDPGSGAARAFLFQLLAVLGQWERAANQLKMLGELDASALITVQMYWPAIQSELLRAAVFGGQATPLLLGEPQQWLAMLLESVKQMSAGEFAAAADLRQQAMNTALACGGTINGERFEWLADADPRLGPCLEMIVEGRYYWTDIANVRALRMEPPTDLRDLVWAQGTVTWANGGQVPVLIPVRYPECDGSSATDAHRLSRRTDWIQQPSETYLGMGQRMFITDAGEYPFLEVRELLISADTAPT